MGMATELLHPALRLVGAAWEMVPMAAVVWAAAVRAAAVQTVTMTV